MSHKPSTIIGLVPAAGRATRLGELSCSKEVLPIPGRAGQGQRPAIAHLLDAFSLAGIEQALVVVRSGKWDVPEAVGDGRAFGLTAAHLVVDETPSVVHTLARADPLISGRIVALGFPDILFEPQDAFTPLLERLFAGSADVVLGLFPTDRCEKTDMVELDERGRATGIVIKQPPRGLRYTWSIAAWRPRFTELLCQAARSHDGAAELQAGEALQRAIDAGFLVDAVPFENGAYLDIGTPEDLARAQEDVLR